MTTTLEISERVAARLAALRAERADRLDPADLPGTMTPRELESYLDRTALLDQQLAAVAQAVEMLAKVEDLTPLHAWREFAIPTRDLLCKELLARPRSRTKVELGITYNLRYSVQCLDFGLGVIEGSGYHLSSLRLGELMREAGYAPLPPAEGQTFGTFPFPGTLDETERKIKALEKQKAQAGKALEEALMTDEEREARIAAAHAANAKPQLKTRGDGSQCLRFPDGRVEEVEIEMETSS
jgi:hypothetical protein